MDRLFERRRELDELDVHFARATAGEGRLVVVEGPAGIGKSRLLSEIRRRAEGSMRVLSARGSGLEGEFAFGAVRQAVRGGADEAGAQGGVAHRFRPRATTPARWARWRERCS